MREHRLPNRPQVIPKGHKEGGKAMGGKAERIPLDQAPKPKHAKKGGKAK